jgi:hypothetical protein
MKFIRDDRAVEPGEYADGGYSFCPCGAVTGHTAATSSRSSAVVSHQVNGIDTRCPDAIRPAPTS